MRGSKQSLVWGLIMEELYRTLGYAKCVELSKKSNTLWEMLELSDTRKSTQIGGVVLEGIAKDFIREC